MPNNLQKRGNILIGKSVVIQRKGGNGVHSKDIPKDSLKHPGNNIQIKLRMKTFKVFKSIPFYTRFFQ